MSLDPDMMDTGHALDKARKEQRELGYRIGVLERVQEGERQEAERTRRLAALGEKIQEAEARLAVLEASERQAQVDHDERQRRRATEGATAEREHQQRATARRQEVEALEARARTAQAALDEARHRLGV